MKQCETCVFQDCKKNLFACNVVELCAAFRDLLKHIPFFGKDVVDHGCQYYLRGEVD